MTKEDLLQLLTVHLRTRPDWIAEVLQCVGQSHNQSHTQLMRQLATARMSLPHALAMSRRGATQTNSAAAVAQPDADVVHWVFTTLVDDKGTALARMLYRQPDPAAPDELEIELYEISSSTEPLALEHRRAQLIHYRSALRGHVFQMKSAAALEAGWFVALASWCEAENYRKDQS